MPRCLAGWSLSCAACEPPGRGRPVDREIHRVIERVDPDQGLLGKRGQELAPSVQIPPRVNSPPPPPPPESGAQQEAGGQQGS